MIYPVRFMIYPNLNLVMNSIRILNNKEISLNFRLIYFMTYTVQFPWINTFVTWRWSRAGAETCRQFKITSKKNLSCVLTHLKPSPYCTGMICWWVTVWIDLKGGLYFSLGDWASGCVTLEQEFISGRVTYCYICRNFKEDSMSYRVPIKWTPL